jgi:hypothetical protein
MLIDLHWFENRSTRNEENSFRLHTGEAKNLLIDALLNYNILRAFPSVFFLRLRTLDIFYEEVHYAMKLKSFILIRKSSNDLVIIINSSIEMRMKWFVRIDSDMSFRKAHATLRIILFPNKIKKTSEMKFRKIIKCSFFAFVIIRLIDSYRAKTNERHTNLIKPDLLTPLIASSN